jgi:hypothetical protein
VDLILEGLPAILVALGTLATAIGALFVSYTNARKADRAAIEATAAAKAAADAKRAAEASQADIVATKDGVFALGPQIDGRLTELLELTRQSALAEGRLEGDLTRTAARTAAATEETAANTRREGPT